jgi:ABC-2 type transport system permease protein
MTEKDVPRISLRKKLQTVLTFTRLNTKRFFRDKLAIFFSVLFPLIFLFVFGSISRGGGKLSFKVAILNDSSSSYSTTFVEQLKNSKIYKIDKTVHNLTQAKDKMGKSQLDGVIYLNKYFGVVQNGNKYPSGQVEVIYTQNQMTAGQTMASVLNASLSGINAKFVNIKTPFTVSQNQLNEKSLTTFDYTFAGLLGFSIIGIGIFGPVNVFPELKKQGILRRLHTTPIKVWQYFLSTMFSQSIIGVLSIAIQFAIAISVFNLKVVGNYLEIIII